MLCHHCPETLTHLCFVSEPSCCLPGKRPLCTLGLPGASALGSEGCGASPLCLPFSASPCHPAPSLMMAAAGAWVWGGLGSCAPQHLREGGTWHEWSLSWTGSAPGQGVGSTQGASLLPTRHPGSKHTPCVEVAVACGVCRFARARDGGPVGRGDVWLDVGLVARGLGCLAAGGLCTCVKFQLGLPALRGSRDRGG